MTARRHQPWSQSPAVRTIIRVLSGRFSGLTFIVVGLTLCGSLIENRMLREVSTALAFSALMIFTVRNVGRRLRLATGLLALPSLLGHWTYIGSQFVPHWLVFASSSALLAMLTMIVLFGVLSDSAISADTIVGALCAYFLMGVTFGTLYALIEATAPGSFLISPALAGAAHWDLPKVPITPLLQYYSFTTLSTLGIGDVSPIAPPARILTALEAMVGQLYLAILIARLVGIHTARAGRGS
jgi:ion channel